MLDGPTLGWITAAVFLGNTLGNYLWQLGHDRDWQTARERTYYQGVALLGVLLMEHIWMRFA